MANLKLRYCLVIFLLTVTASVVSALQYDTSRDEASVGTSLQRVPMEIGNWHGQDLPLDESVYEILETRAIIHRNYTDTQGNTILLSIVYYKDTKVDFHAPEACLGGRGEKMIKSVKSLDLYIRNKVFPLEIAELISYSPESASLSYYFYKAGDFMGQNYIQLRLNIALNKLTASDSSGSLVRISTAINNSEDQSRQLLERFSSKLVPILKETL